MRLTWMLVGLIGLALAPDFARGDPVDDLLKQAMQQHQIAGLSLMDAAFFICPRPFRFRLACFELRIVRFALRCSGSSFFNTPRA